MTALPKRVRGQRGCRDRQRDLRLAGSLSVSSRGKNAKCFHQRDFPNVKATFSDSVPQARWDCPLESLLNQSRNDFPPAQRGPCPFTNLLMFASWTFFRPCHEKYLLLRCGAPPTRRALTGDHGVRPSRAPASSHSSGHQACGVSPYTYPTRLLKAAAKTASLCSDSWEGPV